MKTKRIIAIAALATVLGVSIALVFLQQGTQETIPVESAIAIIKTHIAEKIRYNTSENIRIDKIELRSPTEVESYSTIELGREPPELVWYAEFTRLGNAEGIWVKGKSWLNAYTGEVVLLSLSPD